MQDSFFLMPRTQRSASSSRVVRCRAGAVTDTGVWYGPGSAERHVRDAFASRKCRTASGTQGQTMPQTITRGIKAMIDEANAEIETVSAAEAIASYRGGANEDVVIVDIRDPREIERDGKIPGAFSCTRGMLEFWIDPQSPYAKPIFQ